MLPKPHITDLIRSNYLLGLIICLLCLDYYPSIAQNEYLAILDYTNLGLNRLGNIPGVTWVIGDNSSFDQNHQRFFFQGSATNGPPWTLYTINAVSGAVINNPVCPSGNSGGQVLGLQYDNASDTLYAIYTSGTGTASFSWIEPSTGNVNIKNNLPGYTGYSESSFDEKDHLYIVHNGNNLLVINASSGIILYNLANTSVSDILYDNLTGKLYGINHSAALQYPQFDSITLSTGVVHPIANLPALYLPQIYAYAIDEKAGKYIFLGSDPSSSGCISNYLYTLDINTGAILSRTLYPYAQGTSVISDENVIEYSFDNQRGKLYALNWHPPNSSVSPLVTITASPIPSCAGASITFTAATGTGSLSPSYQWQLNGNNVGTNAPDYTTNKLATGDSVRCIMTNNSICAVSTQDTSNIIPIQIKKKVNASLTIGSSTSIVCSRDTVLFIASPLNGGPSPSYQWQINGINTGGAGSNTFSSSSLTNGDTVRCILTSGLACSLPVLSNGITTTVFATPLVFVGNDTVVMPGESIKLNPSVTGKITSYQWTPSNYLDNPFIERPVANPSSTTTYQLMVTADNGCKASGKITIAVYYRLKMPNAFTPNGDGKNDVFRIPGSNSQKIISFSIFDRWGQLVFRTTNSNSGWDGSFHSQAQPIGTYVWDIQYEDILAKKKVIVNGTVILLR